VGAVACAAWLVCAAGCGESERESAAGSGGSSGAGAAGKGGNTAASGGSSGKSSAGGSSGTNGGSPSAGGADEGAGSPSLGTSGSGAADDGGNGAGGALGQPDEITECNDGIDNDGDGYTDWQNDLGCYGPGDHSEAALPRDQEDGFTTFDIADDSVVVYVSADGDDGADGSIDTPVQTIGRAAALVRDGENDFILLRRGDTFRDQSLGRFKSGRDAAHPLVVAGYGDSLELPRVVGSDYFIDHDGKEKSFVSIVGLHFVVSTRDPDDPDFDGGSGGDGVFRYVGGGKNLLIEGCHIEYGEIVVQSYDTLTYEDVEVRRNVIEKSYHADTCSPGDPNGDSTYRPSGMYSSHVERLTIEGNLFDHNGWNEDVPSACATIYNHNLYLNGNDITIRDNLLTRASSIHIKLRSDTSGDMSGLVVENNYFVEGEIGVSLGGNSEEAYRFADSTIESNVMSDIGRSRPTTRSLAWGLDVQDNDHLDVMRNLFLNQHEAGVGNSYAISIDGDTDRDINVEQNLFYRIQNRSLIEHQAAAHTAIGVFGNTFYDPDQDSCLIDHQGEFTGYHYDSNRFFSSAASDQWFCIDGARGDLPAWNKASGDTGERLDAPDFPDANRSVETYAASLGIGSKLTDFIARARRVTRLEYEPRLGAPALNDYIRKGFGR
jgi:hypothetical protein